MSFVLTYRAKIWLQAAGCAFFLLGHVLAESENWPGFRGPKGCGVSSTADPPVKWSEDDNVSWKIELPCLGHSSPVIWDDLIFLTGARPVGETLSEPKWSNRPGAHNNLPITREQEFVALAVDRKTGAIVWEKVLHRQLPHEGGHETGTLASATPATDANHLFAFFGSYGLYALDHSGKLLWKHDLGDQFTKHGHGEGSSPVLHGNYLVVNWDHEEQSFLTCFDKASGEIHWKRDRDEKTSWATPLIIEEAEKMQVVVSGSRAIRAYDLSTGEEIWSCRGLSDNVVASPVSEPGFLYAASSYNFQAMVAIELAGAKGDITGTDHVVWTRSKRTPYVPSPLLYKGVLYFLAHYQGVMSRVIAKTGVEEGGPFRLLGLRSVYASPVAARDRIYWLDRGGLCLVLSHEETPRPLAVNQLDGRFSASPALAGKNLILRAERHLYCLSETE